METGPRFLCDASLGGLARWLRAAGYEAAWEARGAPEALVGRAQGEGAVLLTSKARLLEWNLVRTGAVRALLVPTFESRLEQLRLVVERFELRRGTPRCMACGGRLRSVAKARVAERIPPRTARWKGAYCVCEACDHLFWEGTHWERILRGLEAAGATPAGPPP
jgi:uncharacterized protein